MHTPELVGSIAHGYDLATGYRVIIDESRDVAYFTADDGISVIDVSDAAAPVFKSRLNSAGVVSPVGTGTLLLAPYFNQDLIVAVDTADRAAPVGVGDCATATRPLCSGLSADGKTVLVGCGAAAQAFDITDPTNITLQGTLADGSGGAIINAPYQMVTDGDVAYLASSGGNAIEVIDFSSGTPTHVSAFTDTDLQGPTGLDMSGDLLYVACAGTAKLMVLDVHDPAAITVVASISIPDGANWVSVEARYAYVSGGTGFTVVHLPSRKVVATVSVPNFFSVTASSRGLFVATRTVVAADAKMLTYTLAAH